MSTGAKLVGAKVFTRKQAIRMKEHRIVVQEALAMGLSTARRLAGENMEENTTGTLNPYRARSQQPSTPGKLTSRTGKLKFMLTHGTTASDPLKSWKIKGQGSSGTKVFKEQNSLGLKGQIKSTSLGSGRGDAKRVNETHKATYRVFITSHGRLWSTYGGMPQETVKTLAVRFNWETGIRGNTRPIFKPILGRVNFDMRKHVNDKNAIIWSK